MSNREDPRIARSRERVLKATLELLADRGFAETSIEAVSARSGVAKTTIYRHWTSREALVAEAFGSMFRPPEPSLGAPLPEALTAIARGLADGLTHGPFGALAPAMVEASERHPEIARRHLELTAPRRREIHDLVAAAVRAGTVRRDVDPWLIVDLLGGAVFFRRLISREPMPRAWTDALVTFLIDGLRPRPARRRPSRRRRASGKKT